MCFSVLRLLCLCARLFLCALRSPAGKELTSWLSYVVSYCEFVTYPLVSWVRCGTILDRFLAFAPFLTFLYSIKVLNLNETETETKMLNDCHDDLLIRKQSLSTRTTLPAVHLLLGALSLEAELHKRYLSLLYSITNSNNQTFHQLIRESSVFCDDHPSSFFSRLKMILVKYEPVHEVSDNVVCATSKVLDQPAHTRSLIRAFASRLSIL